MNYYFQLLQSLDATEMALLDGAYLTPTERKIFLYLRDSCQNDYPADEAVAALSISQNTYYKNCSILLAKSYDTLVPEGGLPLLFFLLKKKFLVAAGMRELHKQERTEVKSMSPKQKERFYFAVFHLLRSVERIEIPMADFCKYGKKLIASRIKLRTHDPLAVQIYLEQRQFTKDLKQTAKRFSPSYIKKYFSLLEAHKRSLAKSKDAFAHFNLHLAAYNYYYNTHTTPECMKVHLVGVLKWLPPELEEIFPWVRSARKLDEGTIYTLTGEYEQAFAFFQRFFNYEILDYVSIRVPMDYCIATLYTDHHEIAEELIYMIHKKDLQKPLENSRTSVSSEMWLAFLYLNWAKYDKALLHLNTALRRNCKGSYSPYNESILRALEICYYFLIKDWDFTEQLVTRNRQWLRRNEFKDPNSPEIAFNDITKNYLDHIFDRKPFREDLEMLKQNIFSTEVSGLIGKFLDKMKGIATISRY